jgi:hypothetical protein
MSFPKTVTELLAVEEPIIRGWITEQIGDHAASNDPGDQFEFEFSGLADGDTLYYDGNAFEWKNTSQLQIDPTNNTVTVSDGKLYIDDGNAVNAALITTDYSIISAEGTAVGLSLVVAGTDPLYRGVIKGVRSRGTVGSPSVPSVDDSVFSILGAIYDGIDTEGTAQIDFIVDGSVSSDVAPQRIAFMTSATTGLARVERLQIKSNGDIIINDTGVASDVTIKGDNDATLFVLDGGSDVLAFGGAVDASYKLKVYGNIWGTGTLTIDGATTYNGAMIIDVDSANALLVRKDGAVSDVFNIDTVTPKITIDADIEFTGAQSITTDAAALTLAPTGNVVLAPGGSDVYIRPATGQIADLYLDTDASSSTFARITFQGHDDLGANQAYARIASYIGDNTAGTEDAVLRFYTVDDGDLVISFTVYGGGTDTPGTFETSSDINTLDAVHSEINFFGNDDAAASQEYSAIRAFISDPTAAHPDGRVGLWVTVAGSLTEKLTVDFDVIEFHDDLQFNQASTISTTAGDLTVSPNANFNVTVDSAFGGSHAPLGVIHADQSSTTGAKPVLLVDQADLSEGFINYVGTSAASAVGPISTWTTGNSIQGFVRAEINGAQYWMPYYDAPTA